MKLWLIQHRRFAIFALAAFLHLAAFAFIRFTIPPENKTDEKKYEVLKLVDVEEYIPPPPPPAEAKVTTVYNQPSASEEIIQSEAPVVEVTDSSVVTVVPVAPVVTVIASESEYLPQHKVSNIPEIPTADILSRIEYPPIALRQGIEGVVYLELYIDQTGLIRKIIVLKDPGYGFAEAAVASLKNVQCKPALANGVPVAVRFRYPVRFTLQ